MTTLPGTLCISRTSSTHDADEIEIRFIDEESHVQFATFHISLENFAKALTGLGYVEGKIEYRGLNRVGKISESKTELVHCKPYGDDKAKYKALAEFEVDGWKARKGDIDNHHHYTPHGVRVVFFRHTGTGVAEAQEAAE